MNLPLWARIVIRAAWWGLKLVMARAGIPAEAVDALEKLLQHLGILGGQSLTAFQVSQRSFAVKAHCDGVACAPELKV